MRAPWEERLLARIEIDPDSGCWLWTGLLTVSDGYGQLKRGSSTLLAHRAVYELVVGPVPHGLERIRDRARRYRARKDAA